MSYCCFCNAWCMHSVMPYCADYTIHNSTTFPITICTALICKQRQPSEATISQMPQHNNRKSNAVYINEKLIRWQTHSWNQFYDVRLRNDSLNFRCLIDNKLLTNNEPKIARITVFWDLTNRTFLERVNTFPGTSNFLQDALSKLPYFYVTMRWHPWIPLP